MGKEERRGEADEGNEIINKGKEEEEREVEEEEREGVRVGESAIPMTSFSPWRILKTSEVTPVSASAAFGLHPPSTGFFPFFRFPFLFCNGDGLR